MLRAWNRRHLKGGNIKINFKEMCCQDMDCGYLTGSGNVPLTECSYKGNKPADSIRNGGFLDHVEDKWPLRQECDLSRRQIHSKLIKIYSVCSSYLKIWDWKHLNFSNQEESKTFQTLTAFGIRIINRYFLNVVVDKIKIFVLGKTKHQRSSQMLNLLQTPQVKYAK
jgi:hypothetical protein